MSNAFTLQEVAPLDFGTVRLSYNYDGTNALSTAASITINANGSPATLVLGISSSGTDTKASFTEILPGSPAEYSITAAAPFTAVSVTSLPTATLTNPASSGAELALTVTATNFEIVGGTNPGDVYNQAGTSNLITDATGAVGFLMGGTLTTPTAEEVTFGDGAYTGTYSVVVDY